MTSDLAPDEQQAAHRKKMVDVIAKALLYEAAWTEYASLKTTPGMTWEEMVLAKGHAHQALLEAVRALREPVELAPGSVRIRQIQCAAISNGCTNHIIWEEGYPLDWEKLLNLNGWRLDYGKWVCWLHHDHA